MKRSKKIVIIICAIFAVLLCASFVHTFSTAKTIHSKPSSSTLSDYRTAVTNVLEVKKADFTFIEKDGSLTCEFSTEGHRYELFIQDTGVGYNTYSLSEYSDDKRLTKLMSDIDYNLLSDLSYAIGQNPYTKREIRSVVYRPVRYFNVPETEIRKQHIRYKTKSYGEGIMLHFSAQEKTEKTFYTAVVTLEDRAK